MPALTDPLPDVTTGAYDAPPAPAAPAQPGQPQQPGIEQQKPPPTIATPDPNNPDAPEKPLVDPTTGDPTTFYGSQVSLVNQFDDYIRSGGDITKLSAKDFATLQKAVDNIPDFINQSASPAAAYARFNQGLEQNIAVEAAKKGILPTAIGQVPGVIGATLGFGKDLFVNTKDFLWQHTIGETGARLADLGDMLHGDFSGSHLAKMQAGTISALGQQTMKNLDFYFRDLPEGGKDMGALYALAKARAATSNPDQAAQLDFKQSEIIRGGIVRQQQDAQDMVDMRNAVAGGYKLLGATDFAQQIVTSKPSDADMFVAGFATDPTNLVTGGITEATKALGTGLAEKFFIKTAVRTARVEEATHAVSMVAEHLDNINSARTNLISILSGDGRPLDAATRSGFEANLQRMNSVQEKLKSELAAANGERASAIAEVNKQMDIQARANPLRQAAGIMAQRVGAVGEMPAQIVNWVDSIPKNIVNKLMSDAPQEAKDVMAAGVKSVISAGVGHLLAGPVGASFGATFGPAAGILGKIGLDQFQKFSHAFRTVGAQYALGQQTLPFWKLMSEKLSGVPSWLASKMDNPLVYAVPSAVTSGAVGAGVGAGLGTIAGGGSAQGFQQGAGAGGLIGAAGGGLGQLRRFNSPAELRQAAIGDRSRFIGSLTPPNREMFLRLHPEYQLSLATYGMAHPDLAMQFEHNPGASNGSYKLDPTPHVTINVAGDNPLEAIASHEVAHHIAAHQLGSNIDTHIRGNPLTGQTGIFNELGPDGKPLVQLDKDGKPQYVMNQQFERYKADYNARKLRDNPGEAPSSDYEIAQEMFAELHASVLSDRTGIQKMIRGYIPSDMFSENATANWLVKMGMGADTTTGNPIPTGSLKNATGLQRVISDFYHQRQYKKMPVESGAHDTKVPVGDFVKGTPEFDRTQINLDSTGDLHRNPDGSIAVDLSGRPKVKTERQADADAAQMGKAVHDVYQRQPLLEGTSGDNYLKLVKDRNGAEYRRGQRVPEAVFSELEQSNQFNANQMLNWRKIDAGMQRNDGSMFNVIYNTASKGKGRYATVPARERSFVPIYSEVSLKNNQVNIKAYDPELMQANLNKRLRSKEGKELYGDNIGAANADVRTYLDNLANDRPGETGLDLRRKGFINELFGFNADANPFAADITKRSPDVFKSFRIDRINRVAEIAGGAEQFHAKTYEQVRSFMQPREEPVAAGSGTQYQPRGAGTEEDVRFQPRVGTVKNPSERAFKAATDVRREDRTPEQHDIVAARAMHEWNTQKDTVPLVARRGEDGHVVTDKDGYIQYKTQDFGLLDAPVVQNLVKKYGKEEGFRRATDLLSNRLAEQYKKWEADPDLRPAIGWYSGMRDRLQASFGATIDKFANMLAATSAQEGVKTNFNYTIEALRKMSKGDYDELMGNFRDYAQQATDRIMGDDSIRNKQEALRKEINKFGNPKGGGIGDVPLKDNGKKYGINSQKVLHALTDYWVDQASGPKTSNFGENLSWRSIDPTIDVWASRTARRLLYEGDVKRWRLHPAAERGVGSRNKSGHDDYTLAESGYRGAAEQVAMNPDDTQAFMWFGEKKHYGDRGWTVGTGATLGDFRNVMDQMKYERYQVGLTTNRGESAAEGRARLLGARRQMEQSIQRLGNVVAQRVTESEGRYGDYNEPTLDTEFTTKQGQSVAGVEDTVKQIAKAHNQDAAFISRIHDDASHPTARPVLEMGFNQPATPEEINQWVDAFKKYELGGFTVARDSRGKAIGIRSQSIPEFAEGAKPEDYADLHQIFSQKVQEMRKDPSLSRRNITYDKDRYADTKIFRKGEHY